jgi:two-component system, response regulator YesN
VTDQSDIRVLLVDDEPRIHSAYQRALTVSRPEWAVAIAGSGREALKLMETSGFDVLVTDIAMGGIDGIDLLRLSKTTFPRMHRMVVSGIIDGRTLVDVHLLAHAHLIKPVTMETLVQAIETLLKPEPNPRG